ncbi:MAG: response regulator [Planctomycetota bacterium]|nr:MAG: response regulator [Planctomycetota bacterium]
MPKLLIIHNNRSVRSSLEKLGGDQYDVTSAKDLLTGIKSMIKVRPDVIVVGHEPKTKEGIKLLRYMRDNTLKTPVILVLSQANEAVQTEALRLGAKGFMEFPVDGDDFFRVLVKARKAKSVSFAPPPPVTDEELNSNLSMLEHKLNRKMKCFAGQNQVYIQSLMQGGIRHKPRICLKCSLRAEYGLNREVYYEFIRDICCRNPKKCKAVRLFKETRIIA